MAISRITSFYRASNSIKKLRSHYFDSFWLLITKHSKLRKNTSSAYFYPFLPSSLSHYMSYSCILPSLPLSPFFFCLPVPGAPPRKLEVEAINSTAIRVTWKPPLQGKQHGQIRGYQVIFSQLENGEPRGQPNIMDVALPEAQVLDEILILPSLSLSHFYCL